MKLKGCLTCKEIPRNLNYMYNKCRHKRFGYKKKIQKKNKINQKIELRFLINIKVLNANWKNVKEVQKTRKRNAVRPGYLNSECKFAFMSVN